MSTENEALAVTCPACKQGPGMLCRSLGGRSLSPDLMPGTRRTAHPERHAVARAAAGETTIEVPGGSIHIHAADPPPITAAQVLAELRSIRSSVEDLGLGGITRKAAASNVARRIGRLEDMLSPDEEVKL